MSHMRALLRGDSRGVREKALQLLPSTAWHPSSGKVINSNDLHIPPVKLPVAYATPQNLTGV